MFNDFRCLLLLADVGGLLGIFSGFSIISIVELVFHMMVQWFCYVFK